jgi:hypothetical protein
MKSLSLQIKLSAFLEESNISMEIKNRISTVKYSLDNFSLLLIIKDLSAEKLQILENYCDAEIIFLLLGYFLCFLVAFFFNSVTISSNSKEFDNCHGVEFSIFLYYT